MSNLDVFLENNKWLETLPNKESNEVTEEIRKNNNIVCEKMISIVIPVCNRKNVFGEYDPSSFIQYVKEKSKKG